MSYNPNLCQLILKHSDISTNTTAQTVNNSIGGWSNYKQSYWFNNINLRTLIGNEDYDKYEIFALRLNQWAYSYVNYTANNADQLHFVQISGLNWLNGGYNQSTGSTTTKAPLIIITMSTNTNATATYASNVSVLFFKKSTDVVTLTFEHFRVSDGTPIQTTTGIPHSILKFDIFPLK